MYELVIGNMNYSSWSLRAWLYMKLSEIEFTTTRIPLFTDQWRERIREYSGACRVPVLVEEDSGLAIWDSLAIIEYLRETHAKALDYPDQNTQRARARSMVAEMHSGFLAVRGELPMNLKQQIELDTTALSSDCLNQIGRIITLWEDCLQRQENDAFLFGDVSIVDVFYAPIVTRFVSYGIEVPERIADYMAAILELDAMNQWYEAALAEQEQIDFVDKRVPVDDTPLNPG